jgi:phosphate starvation-inducible PhoH-like protein
MIVVDDRTQLLSGQGWRRAVDVCPGDVLKDARGGDLVVSSTERTFGALYEVRMSDGAQVVVGAGQRWSTQTHNDRQASKRGPARWRGRTTIELQDCLARGITRDTYTSLVEAVTYSKSSGTPVPPYALGLLLGDGCFRQGTPTFSKPEPQLHQALAFLLPGNVLSPIGVVGRGCASLPSRTAGANPLTVALRDLGLWGHASWTKFIPDLYLRSDPDARLELIQGLLDTDGWVQHNSRGNTSAHYSTSSGRLAGDVLEVVESLGGTVTVQHRARPKHQGGIGRPNWVVRVRLPRHMEPFRLERKLVAWRDGQTHKRTGPVRRIASVEYAGIGDLVHLQVSPTGQAVTGRFIVLG